MVEIRLSRTTVELDTTFFRNLDADPGLVLQGSLLHRLLWLVYCLVADFFLASCPPNSLIFASSPLLGKESSSYHKNSSDKCKHSGLGH